MIRRLEVARPSRADEGFTLVEVVVAMLVLGIVSTGILTSANIVIQMTADNRSREVAVNLAEQQLDADRGVLNPFDIHNIPAAPGDAPTTQTVGNRTYTITQTTSLVSVDGNDITCGSARSVSYRRISVQVDWTGRLPTTAPVASDTVIAPNGRLNDASTGSIAVMVSGATGVGEQGVSVTITPVSGGATALTSPPAATDVDGCSYAMGVTPGTYRVAILKPNSVDQLQDSAPDTQPNDVLVAPGSTAPVSFMYDQSATYPLAYVPGASAVLPDAMAVTALSQGQPWSTSSTAAAPTSLALFPFTSGYSVIAGKEADPNTRSLCAAEDPGAWVATTGVTAGVRGSAPGQQPGSTSPSVTVPMGVVAITGSPQGTYFQAVGQNVSSNGQPGCSSPETFTWSQSVPAGTTVNFAMPYGTYQIFTGTSPDSLTTKAPKSSVNIPLTQYDGPLTKYSGNTLTLDPRPAVIKPAPAPKP